MSDRQETQTHDWNGDSGDRWAANLDRLDRMLEVFGEAALSAAEVRSGERVIDIGSGSGTSSLALADRVGKDGFVLGVDISHRLIDLARAAAPAGLPLSYLEADAATATLPGGFDLLFSRFGVMFFDGPEAAFTRLRASLKPGGRMAFVCWRGAQENDWVRLPKIAVSDILTPEPVDPDVPGPFAFGNRDRLADILASAGFTDVAIKPFDASIPYGRGTTREQAIDDALDMAFQVGPLMRMLAGHDEDVRSRAAAAVREAFARRPGDTSVEIDGAAWIVTARNSGRPGG